jgi:signal transduction histidine kinase/PAS domain-containing protein
VLWLCCMLVLPFVARGQALTPAPLDVAHLAAPATLAPHLAVLRDPSRQLTLDDVTAPDVAAEFVPAAAGEPNFGLTTDAAWARVTLTNSGRAPGEYVLRLDLPGASYVDFYALSATGDTLRTIHTGARLPFANRPLPDHVFAFPLELGSGETQTYYLRVATDFALRLPLTLWPAAVYSGEIAQEALAWAIVVGLVLLLSAFNLLVFLVVRDRDHLLLGLAGSVSVLTTCLVNGFAAPWLGDQAVHFPQIAVIMITLALLTYLALVISFLDLHRRVRHAYFILVGVAVVACIAAVIGLAVTPKIGFALLLACTSVLLLVTLLGTVAGIRQGYRPAIYFLVAQIMPIVLGLLQSTAILGLAPWTPPFVTNAPTSDLLLIVLMSLALADRINIARREAERANRALAASEARILDYLNALPFFVQVHNPDLDLVFSNRTVLQTEAITNFPTLSENYRVTKERVPVRVYGHNTPYPEGALPLMRAAAGELAHADDLLITLSGQDHVLEGWSIPIRDHAGAVTTIVSVFQDITGRRIIESELASYRDHLEQRVEQRTAELATTNSTLHARVTELSAIAEIGQTLSHHTELRPAFQRIAQILTELYGVSSAGIALFAPTSAVIELVCLHQRTHTTAALAPGSRITDDSAARRMAALQAPVLIDASQVGRRVSAPARDFMEATAIQQLLLAPLQAHQQVLGFLVLARSAAESAFDANDLNVANTIAIQVAAALEVGRLFDEERVQRQMADALRETANALSRSLDQDTVLATVLHQLHQVLEYEGAAIALVDEEELVIAGTEGLSERHHGRRTPLTGKSAALAVLRSGAPLLLHDTLTSREWEIWSTRPAVRSWLGAPLVAASQTIGVLNLESTAIGAFNQSQAGLLLAFANQAAIALANARLHRQAQDAAAAGERERIARDLHDAVTQSIFSASLIAEALPKQLPDAAPIVAQNLTALTLLTRGALAELRALLLELRPEHLTETPLDRLLGHLADAFTGRQGTAVTVNANCDPLVRPPPAVQVGVYRIAQEALNNVAKHAQATNVTLNLVVRSGEVRLGIFDDGRGFDMRKVSRERLGFSIMHARAAEIGAQLTIDSEPGMGTHLFFSWKDIA